MGHKEVNRKRKKEECISMQREQYNSIVIFLPSKTITYSHFYSSFTAVFTSWNRHQPLDMYECCCSHFKWYSSTLSSTLYDNHSKATSWTREACHKFNVGAEEAFHSRNKSFRPNIRTVWVLSASGAVKSLNAEASPKMNRLWEKVISPPVLF